MKTNHHSFGIIPICKQGSNLFICCVQNKKSEEWGLPKGTPEGTETPLETAHRELEEETGISNYQIIGGKTFIEKYSFIQDEIEHTKQNTYFIANVDVMKDKSDDIDSKDMKWINITEANDFFRFDTVKNVLNEALKYIGTFPLTSEFHRHGGDDYLFEYYESDSIEHLLNKNLSQVAIMAFYNDKLLIVNNTTKPGMYGPICGGIEPGESPEECLPRELQEESNMKVISSRLIGHQKCTSLSDPEAPIQYQLRYFAQVEPIGPFTPDCDPDGDVTELLEIDPSDYRNYFDWGVVGESIVKRALSFLVK